MSKKIDSAGVKYYYNEKNQLHREDGPAIEYPDNAKMWYLNGRLHRKNGPAVIWANGDKFWYLEGKLVDEKAPALEKCIAEHKEEQRWNNYDRDDYDSDYDYYDDSYGKQFNDHDGCFTGRDIGLAVIAGSVLFGD